MGTPLIHLSSVHYRYPGMDHDILRDLRWDWSGGAVVVTGRSGSGKSTILRLLNGLIPHFHGGELRGDITVAGAVPSRLTTAAMAQRVGFVFQDPELQAVRTTVADDIAFGLEAAGLPDAVVRNRCNDVMERLGIDHLAGRRITSLSGGERQRVALGGVLAVAPRLVVLDEPLSQLDTAGATAVTAALGSLVERGVACVIAEHRTELLPRMACLRLADGRRLEPALPEPPDPPRRGTSTAGDEVWRLDAVVVELGGTVVIEGLSAAGRGGEVVAVTGPNGGGKTTLLRLLAGAVTARAGRVTRRGRAAYLPQAPAALLHRLSVDEEVHWTQRRARLPLNAAPVLAGLGIGDLGQHYPRDLSCGQRQRAALAAVLASNPDLLLLDEPTRGMDAESRRRLVTVLDAHRRAGACVVVATHDQRLIDAIADSVLDVRDGHRVLQPVAVP